MEGSIDPLTRPRSRPLAHVLLPVPHPVLRTVVQIACGVAFLALLAQVRVVIGPVPITGQTLGVLLIGAAYGGSLGVTTTALYLAAGGAGLAVFAGGAAGVATLSGPTGGYLLAFPLAAALVGAAADRGWDRSPLRLGAAMLAATVVIYVLGIAWLSGFAPDLQTALAWGLWPFLIGDAVKIALAGALLPTAWRLLGRRGTDLSRTGH